MPNSAHLRSRSLIAVGGEEATAFLQNLITCDVENLSEGAASFGALLTPQGKILFDFLLYRTDSGFFIDVSAEQAADLTKRLMFYRLRANVDIEPIDDAVYVVWPTDGDGFADPRDKRLGVRLIGATDVTLGEPDWDALRINLGFPECGKDYEASTVFPHEALMDHFGHSGVDFSKGCYVGQEVVSRMQHRGTARSRFVKVASKGGELPINGTEVKAGEKTIGKMGSHAGSNGIALLRLDRTAEAVAHEQEITVGDIVIKPALPDFVTFGWPR
ncbi:MAG: YgfZ/GcvT domain-containing protein [Rhizobiaceae bacterium]